MILVSSPHHGAGAGFAVEDAAVLSRLFAAIEKAEPHSIAGVFKAYNSSRRVRTQRLVTTSREAALVYEFQMPGILDDIEELTANVQERLRWIWDLDVEEHCQDAISDFRNTYEVHVK